jgi:hypothetical protein
LFVEEKVKIKRKKSCLLISLFYSFFLLAARCRTLSGFLIFLLCLSLLLDETDQILDASEFSKHLLVSAMALVRSFGANFIAHLDIDFDLCPLPILHPEPSCMNPHKLEVPLVL